MALRRIHIENFKVFENFDMDFSEGLNILVGDNEVGKSTILEAVHLALTGMINGRYLNTELTQYLFNNAAVDAYLADLKGGSKVASPPSIVIELYFDESVDAMLMGVHNNMRDKDARGVSLIIELEQTEEYAAFVSNAQTTRNVETLPIEYYDFRWRTFADDYITPKKITVNSAMVDSSLARYQNGSDVYISRIVRQTLDSADAVKIAQAHREMRENFMRDISVKNVNENIKNAVSISDKEIELSVELLSKNAWESSLTTHIGKVPFHYIGKGEQCVIKTRLALADKKAKDASVILIEEPENHLTHARLNRLLDFIRESCMDKQIIATTHSSFVANKLGLGNLVLIGIGGANSRLSELIGKGTYDFFRKLPGYDTLRLVLCERAILVEGDSDELIVQTAYRAANGGKLPIERGVDVISVGTSFLRFLEIAALLKKRVAVVTDNDGKIDALKKKHSAYLDNSANDTILISYDKRNHTPDTLPLTIGDKPYNYNTLENLMLAANDLSVINGVLDKTFTTEDEARVYMVANKTECALSVFDYNGTIAFPDYITEAVNYVG